MVVCLQRGVGLTTEGNKDPNRSDKRHWVVWASDDVRFSWGGTYGALVGAFGLQTAVLAGDFTATGPFKKFEYVLNNPIGK